MGCGGWAGDCQAPERLPRSIVLAGGRAPESRGRKGCKARRNPQVPVGDEDVVASLSTSEPHQPPHRQARVKLGFEQAAACRVLRNRLKPYETELVTTPGVKSTARGGQTLNSAP